MWQIFILTEQLIFFYRTIILFIEQILSSKYFFYQAFKFHRNKLREQINFFHIQSLESEMVI
jgi:hypothetical protein